MNIREENIQGTFAGIIQLTEPELHDVIATMVQNIFEPHLGKWEGIMPTRIELITDFSAERGFDWMTDAKRVEWETKIADLFQTIYDLDSTFHDDAGCL